MKSLLLLMLFIVSCSQEPESSVITSSQLTTLRWSQSAIPVQLKISDAFDAQGHTLNTDMANVWETVTGINLFKDFLVVPNKEFNSLTDYYYSDPDDMGIYIANSPVEGLGDRYLAVTQIFYEQSTDERGQRYLKIIHVDIVVNNYDYDFSNDPNDDQTYYYGTLLLHELGHTLGLGHIQNGIMTNTGMSVEENRVSLNDAESAAIISKYSSLVGGAMVGKTVLEFEVDTDLQRILLYMKPQEI